VSLGVVVNGDVEVCPVHDDAGLEALSAAAREQLAAGRRSWARVAIRFPRCPRPDQLARPLRIPAAWCEDLAVAYSLTFFCRSGQENGSTAWQASWRS
jgi:hypothetical protein